MTTSSTTVPIDHAEASAFWFTVADHIRNGDTVAPDSGQEHDGACLAAQAHATLAIAHEQRTANLIAYLAIVPGRPTADRLRGDIETRLGLGEPA